MHTQICPRHKCMTCQPWISATSQTYLLTMLPLDRKTILPNSTATFSKMERQPLTWAYLTIAGAINRPPPCISEVSFPSSTLPLASEASHTHHQKFPVTLRTETEKPLPFLHFCYFFSLHSNSFPLGVSPPPKVSFSKSPALSIKLTHPCLALTLLSLYLPGELTSYRAQ